MECPNLVVLIVGDDIFPLGDDTVHDAHRVGEGSLFCHRLAQSHRIYIVGGNHLIVQSVAQFVVAVDGDVLKRIVKVVFSEERVVVTPQREEHVAQRSICLGFCLFA